MVQIDIKSSSCPNCEGKLAPLFLNQADRDKVRAGLLNIAYARAPHHANSIQVIKHFLFNF